VLSIDFVIRCHEGPRVGVSNGDLEGEEINLSQGSGTDPAVYKRSFVFHIICDKCFREQAMPFFWTLEMSVLARLPPSKWSSEKDSKPRPPSGLLFGYVSLEKP
jgi:hypothetical protein